MAALLEPWPMVETNDSTLQSHYRSHSSLGRKYKKGRIISQRFNKQGRLDTRRETAKTFLLGIPLDENQSLVAHSRLRSLSKAEPVDNISQINPIATPITPLSLNLQRNISLIDSPKTKRKKVIAKRHSQVQLGIDTISSLAFKDVVADSRRMAFLNNGHPLMYSTILPYEKPGKKNRADGPVTSHHRIRTNSFSAHIDVGAMDLLDSTQEFSLANNDMLASLWINEGISKEKFIRHQFSNKRILITHQISLREGLSSPSQLDTSNQYPWQFFRENHTPKYVLINYHPDCLDNTDYFIGRHVTELNLTGFIVSIVKYARESDIKKAINGQFSDVFPHVKISLTKLRSIKQEMLQIGAESGLGPVPLAHSHVYFEKLVLMGNVNKANRKIIACISLVLASKFASDMKRSEIKSLIEEVSLLHAKRLPIICDKLRLSQKELMSFEFPTLVALQFSLMTPTHQLQSHFDRIKNNNILLK